MDDNEIQLVADPSETIAAKPKAKGWPKGKPRGPRVALREPTREANSEPLRDVEYTPDGKIVVFSSSGEGLTRKRTISSDQFHIPAHLIPHGMSYQWNTVEVMGQPQVQHQIGMRENGWRSVPLSRHADMFGYPGYKGNEIIRDGLRLEERPIQLTQEAEREEAAKANRLVRDQLEQHGLTQKMPEGFSRENPNLRRMERQGTSRTYAPAPDAPRPQLPIDPTYE